MKVLLINHFPLQGSGSGIYTMNIAKELIEEGHDVFVIDIDNEIDKKIYSFKSKTIICDSSKNSVYDLPFNFPCFTTHPRSTNTYYDLTSEQIKEYISVFLRVTKEVIRDFKPDIIHAQHLWITPYIASQIDIPYVITAHGTDLMGFKKDSRYHQYANFGAEKSKFVIAISNQVFRDVNELFVLKKEQVVLNPNGFDDSIFRIKDVKKNEFLSSLGIKSNPNKVVSFVGKLAHFKGIDILIKSIPIINKEIPNIVFAFAGNGQLKNELEELAKTLDINNLFFLGHQTQEAVSSLYNIADVSVVPSRIEPFGLVAIEALACGTPVVATNAGGLPDFINNEVGQLVEMENHEKLAKAIIYEISNNTKKTKGKFAAEYAKKNYSWKESLKKVVQIYKDALLLGK